MRARARSFIRQEATRICLSLSLQKCFMLLYMVHLVWQSETIKRIIMITSSAFRRFNNTEKHENCQMIPFARRLPFHTFFVPVAPRFLDLLYMSACSLSNFPQFICCPCFRLKMLSVFTQIQKNVYRTTNTHFSVAP